MARAVPPAPPVLLGAMQAWGIAGNALALETLKRSLGTAVQSRDLVVGSALACRLLDRLLALLDWRAEGSSPAGPQVPLSQALIRPACPGPDDLPHKRREVDVTLYKWL